jgi:hypothetical protein
MWLLRTVPKFLPHGILPCCEYIRTTISQCRNVRHRSARKMAKVVTTPFLHTSPRWLVNTEPLSLLFSVRDNCRRRNACRTQAGGHFT